MRRREARGGTVRRCFASLPVPRLIDHPAPRSAMTVFLTNLRNARSKIVAAPGYRLYLGIKTRKEMKASGQLVALM